MGQTAKISNHVIQEIDELICNPEELDQHAAVFDIKIGEESYGPIEAEQLKDFFLIHNELADQTQVKRTNEALYVHYFEHPHFQRRKPQLVSQHSLEDIEHEYLWVLKDGQKNGPYTKTQLSDQVERSELLRTDLISIDEGKTWQRLYVLDEFDRRRLEANQLPATPQGQVFVNSLRETRSQLASENTLNKESDALTGLAYIGNLRNHKGAASEKRIPRPMGAQVSGDQTQDTEENGRPETHFVWYGLFVASLVGILALLFTWQNNPDPRPASQPTQQQRQPARMAEEIKPQETQQNQAPKAAQRPVSQNQDRSVPPTPEREPIDTFESQESNNTTSFRESRAFKQAEARSNQQEREMQEDPYQDDYYYDQGDRPPEQDPVRSQLSRETTDPRNSWADDLESINDNPEYYEPEYVEPGVYPEEELYEEY